MKKTTPIFIFLLVVFTASVSAAFSAQTLYNGNINFVSRSYKCTDTTCNAMNSYEIKGPSSSNLMSFAGSGTQANPATWLLFHYDQNSCSVPKITSEKLYGDGNLGSITKTLSFSKTPGNVCGSMVENIQKSTADVVLPGTSVSVTANLRSAWDVGGTLVKYIPSELDPYFNSKVDVYFTVYKDGYSNVVYEEHEFVTINWNEMYSPVYDYTVLEPGTYTFRIATRMENDCKCAQPSNYKYLEVTVTVPAPYCGDSICNDGNSKTCEPNGATRDDICTNNVDTGNLANGICRTTGNDACTYCGDAVKQSSEQCDDGNTNNNDACRNDCTHPICGDGYLNPGEECDDGNQNNNDGCSNECKLPRCGDSICNDGNSKTCEPNGNAKDDICTNNVDTGDLSNNICRTTGNDACTYCGDAVRQSVEQCDDGNTNNNDACRNDCTHPICGDGYLNPGEECDDGNNVNDDACSNECKTPRCGDSICNDGASATCEPDGSSQDFSCPGYGTLTNNICRTTGQYACTYCGDHVLQDQAEQCDDGNRNNNDGCNAHCEYEYCGDGIIQPGEACDDGNNNNGDGCSAECNIEYCGDGIVQENEECDDGNENNTDECSNECTINYCEFELTKSDNPDPVEPGDYLYYHIYLKNVGTRDCTGGGVQLKEYYDSYTTFVSSQPMPWEGNNLWNFETVEPGEEHTVDIKMKVNEDAVCDEHLVNKVCVWSAETDRWDCVEEETLVVCPIVCGNGEVEEGEQCDDGNENNADSCRNDCTLPYCGDNIIDANEACDDGNNDDGDGCSSECNIEYCGDGIVQENEECDDGNDNNTDECSNECTINYCEFELTKSDNPDPVEPGDYLYYHIYLKNVGTRDCTGGGVQLKEYYDSYTTFVSSEPAPWVGNNLWNFETVEPGEEHTVDIKMKVNEDAVCDEHLVNKVCVWSVETDRWDCVEEETLVVCPIVCGNGEVEEGEQCDDGNLENKDGCSSQCVVEYCGDGIDNNNENEECDDGNDNDYDTCSNTCQQNYCGDEIVNNEEECDDGNENNNDACSNLCTLNYCGDNVINNGEQCDDGNNNDGDGCSSECLIELGCIEGHKENEYGSFLQGWDITLYKEGNDYIELRTTNNQGYYRFENLLPGIYIVKEVMQEGWEPYTGYQEEYEVEVSHGDECLDVIFKNRLSCENECGAEGNYCNDNGVWECKNTDEDSCLEFRKIDDCTFTDYSESYFACEEGKSAEYRDVTTGVCVQDTATCEEVKTTEKLSEESCVFEQCETESSCNDNSVSSITECSIGYCNENSGICATRTQREETSTDCGTDSVNEYCDGENIVREEETRECVEENNQATCVAGSSVTILEECGPDLCTEFTDMDIYTKEYVYDEESCQFSEYLYCANDGEVYDMCVGDILLQPYCVGNDHELEQFDCSTLSGCYEFEVEDCVYCEDELGQCNGHKCAKKGQKYRQYTCGNGACSYIDLELTDMDRDYKDDLYCDDCIDMDKDGACDNIDNCPYVSNPTQVDSDNDGFGNACDEDRDGDGYPGSVDCNDWNNDVHPDAEEVKNNDRDDDCDAETSDKGKYAPRQALYVDMAYDETEIRPGEEFLVSVSVTNTYSNTLKNVKIQLFIPGYGEKQVGFEEKLKKGETVTKIFKLNMPKDMEGYEYLKATVSTDSLKRGVYRELKLPQK